MGLGLGLLNCLFFSIDCYVVFGQAKIGVSELFAVLSLKAVKFGHSWIADMSDGSASGRSMIFGGVMPFDVRRIGSGERTVAALVVAASRIGRSASMAHLSS